MVVGKSAWPTLPETQVTPPLQQGPFGLKAGDKDIHTPLAWAKSPGHKGSSGPQTGRLRLARTYWTRDQGPGNYLLTSQPGSTDSSQLPREIKPFSLRKPLTPEGSLGLPPAGSGSVPIPTPKWPPAWPPPSVNHQCTINTHSGVSSNLGGQPQSSPGTQGPWEQRVGESSQNIELKGRPLMEGARPPFRHHPRLRPGRDSHPSPWGPNPSEHLREHRPHHCHPHPGHNNGGNFLGSVQTRRGAEVRSWGSG